MKESKIRPKRFNVELFSAGMAILLSVLSIVVAYRSELTQREMLAASIWPYVEFSHGNVDEEGKASISFSLRNAGTGPARIRRFQMYQNDRPIASVNDLLDCCLPNQQGGAERVPAVSNPVLQHVLPANEGLTYFQMSRSASDESLWNAFNKARYQMWVQVCYCSVLDDCWVLDSKAATTSAVDSCDPMQATGFQG